MREILSGAGCELSYEQAVKAISGSRSDLTLQVRFLTRPSKQFDGPRGCIPVLWCFCVQDSPSNPCKCTGPIIWIPEDSLRDHGRPQLSKDGSAEIVVDGNTRVFVEDTREVGGKNAGSRLMRLGRDDNFEAVADTLWLQEFMPMRLSQLNKALKLIESHPKLGSIAKKSKGVWGKIVAAFEAGWEIGTAIDEETGLSDKISDWMIETFGPFPE